jgi:opacity protein-like surface antigen
VPHRFIDLGLASVRPREGMDEAMGSVRCSLVAAAAGLISTGAMAADLPVIMPAHPPILEEFGGGWYLRGDLGFSNQQVSSVTNPGGNPAINPVIISVVPNGLGFDAAPIFDIGFGYRWNNWLRFDATAQYRGSANFHDSDNTRFLAGGVVAFGADNYTARKSEILALANAYIDLGTWWCITPFIGAGIGAAEVNIMGFRDDGNVTTTVATNHTYFADASKWNFAWAAHAGLAYKVTPNVTLEMAYHYVNMGSGQTGLPHNFDGSPINPASANAPFSFNTITSHDLTIGMRWQFDSPMPPAMPLSRRG